VPLFRSVADSRVRSSAEESPWSSAPDAAAMKHLPFLLENLKNGRDLEVTGGPGST
jgi:hypothetical protein